MSRFLRSILPVKVFVVALLISSSGCEFLNAQQRELSFFIRFKVKEPKSESLRVITSGYRHEGAPWRFPRIDTDVKSGEWSEWIDLTEWNWHGKIYRAGGIAEYPSLFLSVFDLKTRKRIEGCEFEVQLADGPYKHRVQISFTEKSEGSTIIFLAPYPLRKNKKEFETARQMSARHSKWAKEATENRPINLKKFEIISNLWTRHDPFVVNQELETMRSLGFNVYAGSDFKNAAKFGMKTVGKTTLYTPDPDKATIRWNKTIKGLTRRYKTLTNLVDLHRSLAYYEISDEVSALNFTRTEKSKLDKWFQSYLKTKKLGPKDFGANLKTIAYPIKDMYKDSLPKSVPLRERKVLYHASKFGQWWSVKQLKHTSTLIKGTFPTAETGTLLPSHGFLGGAWGPTKIGMTYQMLDSFELADQKAVTQISTEDWMGLNHMYGPKFTWTGGQTFGYLNAINRSAIGDRPILMRTFITVSDDHYLRLKAYSAIGQGVKSIYFWSYGPTFASTENYWSDLKSHYFGVAKLNRALEKVEDVVHPAKTVSDPVAILYSVSHDIWNNDRQAVFVERRLLWHGLRHLNIQPDFVREESVEAGSLKKYKVLYITDWNISRKASAAIDKWIRAGGVVYLSAGAATRDEYHTPYTPAFSRFVWSGYPASDMKHVMSSYNERTVLPSIEPLTSVDVSLNNQNFQLPVIGVRSNQNNMFDTFARFSDGLPAGKIVPYGLGKIVAVGFMPMLAYGKLANFQPSTVGEKWKPEARAIISKPLEFAGIEPIAKSNVPVVEVNYLEGDKDAAIVLANYTYKGINDLIIDVKTDREFTRAISAEGSEVKLFKQSNGKISLKMKLDWTDIVTLHTEEKPIVAEPKTPLD